MENINVLSFKSELERRRADAEASRMKRLVLTKPIKEMIATSQGALDLIQKVRVDVEFGLAEVPLLYQPLFERIDGPFPGRAVQLGENLLQANIVFLEKFEAGEVQFGTMSRGVPKFVTLQTYAAAFEYTEDMVEWDSTFELEMLNRAMGRAYNYLLNHLHLSPIITYTYTTGAASNTTPFDTTAGADTKTKTLNTFRTAYMTAVQAKPQRTPSVILASEADRFQIEDALLAPIYDANGNPLPRVPVDTIIYYDGASVQVGNKTYTYPGVTPTTAYFIMPRAKMKEFVHHDLRVDASENHDLSRLITSQIVGRARRGLYADMPNSVQKVVLT